MRKGVYVEWIQTTFGKKLCKSNYKILFSILFHLSKRWIQSNIKKRLRFFQKLFYLLIL